VWIGGHYFDRELCGRIEAAAGHGGGISRRALSRQVCEWLSWSGPSGKLAEVSCRKALAELERRGQIRLPEVRHDYAFHLPAAGKPVAFEIPELDCSLEDLGAVTVELVGSRYSAASRTWNALLDAAHYLGRGPLCGAQLRYLVHSERHGVIGALAFSSAVPRLGARDELVGWSRRARTANLARVVGNTRFVIPSTIHVPNLASYVLSRAVARLSDDWHARYGVRPVLAETFVDPARFAGTCYRAANWKHVGQTAGRDLPFSNGRRSSGAKDIYLLPLTRTWRSSLCAEPARRPLFRPRVTADAQWAEVELGGADLGDERLRRRLIALADDFCARPGKLVPEACGGSAAKTKAAYRLMSNPAIDLDTVLAAHVEATAARIREHPLVLAVQDTTSLNYTTHRLVEGLGPINTVKDANVGLLLHETIAFTEEGTPLGVISAQCWARDPEETGKRHRRYELDIEDKESMKWLKGYHAALEIQRSCPATAVVVVSDRESDLYELFVEAARNQAGPRLLIRAERSRNRKAGEENLWAQVMAVPPAGFIEVQVPRQHARPARMARLAISFLETTLKPPKRKPGLPAVRMTAVLAREVDAAASVKEPLEWMLLTTVSVAAFEDAVRVVQWYCKRWGIEVYHRILKSGCRIEDRRLNTADRLEACLAIDLVVAWRIFFLTKLGRETPDLPCTVILEEDEWRALVWYVTKTPPTNAPPTLRQAIRMIASLGGFLGRKGDGEPGPTTIWRGYEHVMVITSAYRVFVTDSRAGPTHGVTCG